MWIWLAMLDLRLRLLYGEPIHSQFGLLRIPVVLGVVTFTADSFYLNAVFTFAVSQSGQPDIRAGFAEARARRAVTLTWGSIIGLALGGTTAVFPLWGVWAWAYFEWTGITRSAQPDTI